MWEHLKQVIAGLLVVAGCGSSTGLQAGSGAATDAATDATSDIVTPRDAVVVDAPSTASYTSCQTAADCQWGEIRREILARSDCMCLFGCPSTPLNRATVARRNAQYMSLCTPGRDGNGQPCPEDDCSIPPPLECRMGACVPPGG